VLYGSDFMVLGFPQCANSYYFLIQLDNDLRPVFHLLETRTDESNSSNADANQVIRFNKIDINHMQIGEDEYSMNLFDTGKALQVIDGGSLRPSGNEKLLPLTPSLSSSFSSLVDEVFENNTSSSTIENQHLPPSSLPSTHLSSFQVGPEGLSGTACLPELGNSIHPDIIDTSEVAPDVSLNSDLLSSSSGPARISSMPSNCKSGHGLSSLRSLRGHDISHGSKSLQLVSSDSQGGTFFTFLLSNLRFLYFDIQITVFIY